MLAQRQRVTYNDGTTVDVLVTQWALGQWARYEMAQGWHNPPGAPPGMASVLMMRYAAWSELFRTPNTVRPSFDAWDQTVNSVDEVEDPAPAEELPTQPATSAG
jgi:hypothetical protein